MKKGNIVKPVGLKGNQVINRMKELMGATSINENTSGSVVELTKEGPDGKIYAVIRENHEYYIKIAENKENLVTEDFNYVGGLQNKKDKAYPSYAKAIKMLNLKFMSLNEAAGKSGQVNTFLDDNLITEHHGMNPNAKISADKSWGDNDEYVVNKKGEELEYDADEDTENHGSNVAKGTAEADNKDVKLTENESAIDEMITGKVEEAPKKKGYSIAKAMMEMDSVIDELAGEDSKIEAILESLGEDERAIMMEALKKKD
jgi:hypothetical protein